MPARLPNHQTLPCPTRAQPRTPELGNLAAGVCGARGRRGCSCGARPALAQARVQSTVAGPLPRPPPAGCHTRPANSTTPPPLLACDDGVLDALPLRQAALNVLHPCARQGRKWSDHRPAQTCRGRPRRPCPGPAHQPTSPTPRTLLVAVQVVAAQRDQLHAARLELAVQLGGGAQLAGAHLGGGAGQRGRVRERVCSSGGGKQLLPSLRQAGGRAKAQSHAAAAALTGVKSDGWLRGDRQASGA